MKLHPFRPAVSAVVALMAFACCSAVEVAPPRDSAAIVPAAAVRSDDVSVPERDVPPAPEERLAALERARPEKVFLRFGSERLFDPEYFGLVAGKRVAIMANQTARATVDRLIDDPRLRLAAVFAPEHGFTGTIGAGLPVMDTVYRSVPVYARYGGGDETRRIPPELLADIDVLLFEIQDVGTRHYTYISSMYLAMDSAADAGVPFVVLDRPVAVNGVNVEGPVLAGELQTFVGVGGLPNRYAMTIGELALLFRHEAALMHGPRFSRAAAGDEYRNVKDVRLIVVPMTGYDRTLCWDEQPGAREWIPPSPNIPSVGAALCYVGAGLFDGNAIGEMVGGYEQFTVISIPYVRGPGELDSFLAAARRNYDFPGVELKPAADDPHGRTNLVRLEVTDRARFNSSYAALALLYTLVQLYPDRPFFSSNDGRLVFGRVNGSPWLVSLFAGPESLPPFSDILKRIAEEEEAFHRIRSNYLLY